MSERTDRITSLLRELTANFIRNEANTPPLITVTNANISPDLKNATILISVFPEDREADALIFLKRKGGDLRSYAKKNMHIKEIPFFSFEIDYGEKHRQHFDAIREDVAIPDKEDDGLDTTV